MKRFFKFMLLLLCVLSVSSVYAETGNYTYGNSTYCYTKDGSLGQVLNYRDTTCPGYYAGTVPKFINGQPAYCAQGGKDMSMSTGHTCTLVSGYTNQYDWMANKWTEKNAVRVGYMIQAIKAQGYGNATEVVYIHNGINNMLQFGHSTPYRTLNANIQKAIDSSSSKVEQFIKNKQGTGNVVSASFTKDSLENVGNSYSKGAINLSLVNANTESAMTVTASCSNCKVYTDSDFTKEFSSTVVNASKSSNLTLYVKTNGLLKGNTKVSVEFTAKFSEFSYPVGKLWYCGEGKQSLISLSTEKTAAPSKSATASATVKEEKLYCKVVDGKYYGKNGTEVKESQYKDECLNICKVVDGKYYDKNGKEVNEDTYKEQCTKLVCEIVNGNYYGKNGTKVTESQYKDECSKPVCKIVNGKYYDKNGKEVNEDTYREQCTKLVCEIVNGNYYGKNGTKVTESKYRDECLNICKVVNGKYYGKDGKEVTESAYKEQCTKLVCEIVNGKYYGSNGILVSKDVFEKECNPSNPVCRYENGKYYGSQGTEVTEAVYKAQCPTTVVYVPSTGTSKSAIPFVLGSILVIGGLGTIAYNKKRKVK